MCHSKAVPATRDLGPLSTEERRPGEASLTVGTSQTQGHEATYWQARAVFNGVKASAKCCCIVVSASAVGFASAA